MRKLRQKRKEEDLLGYLQSERERLSKIKERKLAGMTPMQKDQFLEKDRKRKRLERARAKLEKDQNKKKADATPIEFKDLNSAYSCTQTLSKAVTKTMRSLPFSPTKQKAVISKMAQRVGLTVQEESVEAEIRNSSMNFPQ